MDDDENLTSKEFIEKHRGEEMVLDDNICECATWIVGERRCSCGNVRVYPVHEDWGWYLEQY